MAFDYFGPDYVLPTAPSPEKGLTSTWWMVNCAHCKTCGFTYLLNMGMSRRNCWRDEAAHFLHCDECDKWER